MPEDSPFSSPSPGSVPPSEAETTDETELEPDPNAAAEQPAEAADETAPPEADKNPTDPQGESLAGDPPPETPEASDAETPGPDSAAPGDKLLQEPDPSDGDPSGAGDPNAGTESAGAPDVSHAPDVIHTDLVTEYCGCSMDGQPDRYVRGAQSVKEAEQIYLRALGINAAPTKPRVGHVKPEDVPDGAVVIQNEPVLKTYVKGAK